MAVTLALVKQHLRVEHIEEDDLILIYVRSALTWLQTFTGLPLEVLTDEAGTVLVDSNGVPLTEEFASLTRDMDMATLLITASFYQCRGEGSIPEAAKMLANPYRCLTFAGG